MRSTFRRVSIATLSVLTILLAYCAANRQPASKRSSIIHLTPIAELGAQDLFDFIVDDVTADDVGLSALSAYLYQRSFQVHNASDTAYVGFLTQQGAVQIDVQGQGEFSMRAYLSNRERCVLNVADFALDVPLVLTDSEWRAVSMVELDCSQERPKRVSIWIAQLVGAPFLKVEVAGRSVSKVSN